MQKKPFPNFKLPSVLGTLLLLAILTGCGTKPTPPPAPTDPGPTSTPLACSEFAPMAFSEGKPGATATDVEDAIKQGAANPADPLAWVRGVVGDTMTTRGAIDGYVARRRALGCRP